jgi:hypothetical protein
VAYRAQFYNPRRTSATNQPLNTALDQSFFKFVSGHGEEVLEQLQKLPAPREQARVTEYFLPNGRQNIPIDNGTRRRSIRA